jgi:hypothetical protein
VKGGEGFRRIHIVGASGSGTTSLASAIAAQCGHRHLDTDDFFWMPTSPPYRGVLAKSHLEFLDWAGRYDTGGLEMRSRALHEAWLATLPCAVLRLEGELSVAEQLVQIRRNVNAVAGLRPVALPRCARPGVHG